MEENRKREREVCLEEKVEIGGVGGGREGVIEEKLEVLDGSGGRDVESDGLAG